MAMDSVEVLIHQPESLTTAIMDQWVIEGGVRDRPSTDAVLELIYALRRRELGRLAAQATRTASTSPSGRRIGD
eukprot:11781039-Alexandrium_andersonii.AAC.1